MKKAKATTFRPISPELGPRESPQESKSSSDPETFQCAFDMLVVAWKERYPEVKFPVEKVCFLPMNKSPLLAPQERTSTERVHQQEHSQQVDCFWPIEKEGMTLATHARDIRLS
jgi:hypothetical protein